MQAGSSLPPGPRDACSVNPPISVAAGTIPALHAAPIWHPSTLVSPVSPQSCLWHGKVLLGLLSAGIMQEEEAVISACRLDLSQLQL